jgi:hypothetical protein
MICPACSSDLGVPGAGFAFCPRCGHALSRRTTAQLRAAPDDTAAILSMVEGRYEELRRHSAAPDDLLLEGQRLVEAVRRRDVTAPDVWRAEFDALLRWVRAVGEFKTQR